MSKKSDIFWATQKRGVPDAFKLFTGNKERRLVIAIQELHQYGFVMFVNILLVVYLPAVHRFF